VHGHPLQLSPGRGGAPQALSPPAFLAAHGPRCCSDVIAENDHGVSCGGAAHGHLPEPERRPWPPATERRVERVLGLLETVRRCIERQRLLVQARPQELEKTSFFEDSDGLVEDSSSGYSSDSSAGSAEVEEPDGEPLSAR